MRLAPRNFKSLSLQRPLFAPLLGLLVGTAGGLVYSLGAAVFPSSVAVILSMTATALATVQLRAASIFYVLIKYNALMALCTAKLPFAAPPNIALGFILVCAHAASFALMASFTKISGGTLIAVLLLGFVPAAVLGIPGLIALAAGVAACSLYAIILKRGAAPVADADIDSAQALGEVCFYLGALASWSYV